MLNAFEVPIVLGLYSKYTVSLAVDDQMPLCGLPRDITLVITGNRVKLQSYAGLVEFIGPYSQEKVSGLAALVAIS